MARIGRLFEVESDARKEHGPVDCGYRTFDTNGKTLLQLDTYGSTQRAQPGTISQSLQVDEATAEQLIEILERAFPRLAKRS